MKTKILAVIIVLVTVLSATAGAYEQSELEEYIRESSNNPKDLDWAYETMTFNLQSTWVSSTDSIHMFKSRLGVLVTILVRIGFAGDDIPYYDNSASGVYSFMKSAFRDNDMCSDLAYELGLILGDGQGMANLVRWATRAETAAFIIRCIVPNPPDNLDDIYELAKELNIVRPDDSFYDEPHYPITREELTVMVGRMREHEIIVPPITPRLAGYYISVAEKNGTKNRLAEIWNYKPIRRGTMYQELIDTFSFDGMSSDEVLDILGNYQVECTDDYISYDTYVYEEIQPWVEYVYTEAAIVFHLDGEGKVVGEPELIESDVKFSQRYTDDSRGTYDITIIQSGTYNAN